MSKHTATISVNGVEILSYVADQARILSPSTIPMEVAQDIANYAALGGIGASVGTRKIETTRMSENVFRITASIEIGVGRKVEPSERGYAGHSHYTYVDTPRVEAQWVGTSTYGA